MSQHWHVLPLIYCVLIISYYCRCDELQLDGTGVKPSGQLRSTYGTALKMRAAMTYAFCRLHGLGNMNWQRAIDGSMVGNPSISEEVSRYIVSLHRRKVKAGETTTSARAITAVGYLL